MKIKIFFALIMMLSLMLSMLSSAAYSKEISPAIEILRNKTKLIKSGPKGSRINFSPSDFEETLGYNEVDFITVSDLPSPSIGVLKLGGLDVLEGQNIARENLSLMSFLPIGEALECAFKFKDSESDYSIVCELIFYEGENSAPTAQSRTLSTYRNVAVFSSLEAADAEGDSLRYEIINAPEKGVLTFSDSESGSFIYRPMTNYTGNDSFTYRVFDKYGNASEIQKINLKVAKQYRNILFSDMMNNPYHAAAIEMVERGITELIFNKDSLPVFYPDENVSKGEFLAMAMRACKLEITENAEAVFKNDSEIPQNIKKYAAAAFKSGIIESDEDDAAVFYSSSSITVSEAATIIYNLIMSTPNGEKQAMNYDILVNSKDNLKALIECRVWNNMIPSSEEHSLTRGECAALLKGVVDFNESTSENKGFFAWLFG